MLPNVSDADGDAEAVGDWLPVLDGVLVDVGVTLGVCDGDGVVLRVPVAVGVLH